MVWPAIAANAAASTLLRRVGDDAAVAADDHAGREVELAPPGHVSDVAECADHGDAGALVGLRQLVGDDRHLDAVQRGDDRSCRTAAGNGRRPGGRRVRRTPRSTRVGWCRSRRRRRRRRGRTRSGGRPPAARGPPSRPGRQQSGSRRPTSSAASWLYASPRARLRRKARWLMRRLRASIVAYRSDQSTLSPSLRNIASNACSSICHELVAELEEVRPRDRDRLMVLRRVTPERRLEAGHVRLARIAAHAEVVLHPALGRESVVVPPHRIEDLLAAHALEAGDRCRCACS